MVRFALFAAILLVTLPAPSSADASSSGDWICPPCGCSRDGTFFEAAGTCPECHMELVNTASLRSVAILVYEGVELLDFSGPGEVFAAAHQFRPFTLAATRDPVTSQGFVEVTPQYGIDDAPHVDIVVVPGGSIGAVLDDPALMEWLRETAATADHVMSVCNGALVLAEAGLLNGLEATTHHSSLAALRAHEAGVTVRDDRRWVDTGKIITCAGVSAGIDGSLHLVARLDGNAQADAVARYMEYDAWNSRTEETATPN